MIETTLDPAPVGESQNISAPNVDIETISNGISVIPATNIGVADAPTRYEPFSVPIEPGSTAEVKSIFLPEIPKPRPAQRLVRRAVFLVTKKWEGLVTSKSDESFWARLRDVDATNPVDEEDEFLMSDIRDDDKALVQEGAQFFFSIGHFYDEVGTLRRSSTIHFRRFPRWTADEVIDAYNRTVVMREH